MSRRRVREFLRLGAISGVVQQFRPPQLSDFGGGGPDSPIVINASTGAASILVNGSIVPLTSLVDYITIVNTTGPHGPIYVNRNPASTAAGEALGFYVNISSNVQATPGANDYVGGFVRVTNDGRPTADLWGLDIVAQQGGAVAGNHEYRAIEAEVSGDTSGGVLQTNAFSGIGLRYNGVEAVVINGSSTLTSGFMVWANNAGPTGWWSNGMSISRAALAGISFEKLAGDGANPFALGIFDLSTINYAQTFVRGHVGGDTPLNFQNCLVGIGGVPTVRLEVTGAVGNGVPALAVHPDAGSAITWVVQRSAGGGGTATMGTSSNHNVAIMVNATEVLRFDTANDLDFLAATNGAAAAVGTLNNAPAAGNPAYWLRIKIAGVTRYVPAW